MEEIDYQAIDEKIKFVEIAFAKLSADASDLQRKLILEIERKFIALLESNNGRLVYNSKNISLSSAISKIFNTLVSDNLQSSASTIAKSVERMNALNQKYYGQYEAKNGEISRISSTVQGLVDARLGIAGDGSFSKNGFLDSFVRDESLRNQLRQSALKAISQGDSFESLARQYREKILGNENLQGAFERYYKTYLFDTLQQVDRFQSKKYAEELGLSYAKYQGGLIENSRPFCRKRNNKVFSVKQMQSWATKNGEPNPETLSAEEMKGLPRTGYNPEIDMGGYNCRHHITYISDTEAEKQNPGITKEEEQKLKNQPGAKTKEEPEEDLKQVRKSALPILREKYLFKTVNNSSLNKPIYINSAGIDKVLSQKSNHKVEVINSVKNDLIRLIERAEFITSAPDNQHRPDIKKYLYMKVIIGGKEKVMVLREYRNGKIAFYSITDKKK